MTEDNALAGADRKLPGLPRAVNDEDMRALFSSSLNRQAKGGDDFISQVRHKVLKYTPGKRCVIEYWLYPRENRNNPRRIIGKLYRKDRGRIIFDNLRQLWQDSLGRDLPGERFGMPEPLIFLPEIGIVLQHAVPGRQLSSFSASDDLPAAIRGIAENAAALHRLPVTVGEKKLLDDHLKKYYHPYAQAFREACPELAPLVESILAGLASDDTLRQAPICPAHGDLGLTQIFIEGDRAFFIDFDGFCLSHAALDVSNFLIALQVHFGSQSEALTAIFLETYLKRQSATMLPGLKVYQALIYLRRAMICFRRKTGAEWRRVARQLLEKAEAMLEEARLSQ